MPSQLRTQWRTQALFLVSQIFLVAVCSLEPPIPPGQYGMTVDTLPGCFSNEYELLNDIGCIVAKTAFALPPECRKNPATFNCVRFLAIAFCVDLVEPHQNSDFEDCVKFIPRGACIVNPRGRACTSGLFPWCLRDRRGRCITDRSLGSDFVEDVENVGKRWLENSIPRGFYTRPQWTLGPETAFTIKFLAGWVKQRRLDMFGELRQFENHLSEEDAYLSCWTDYAIALERHPESSALHDELAALCRIQQDLALKYAADSIFLDWPWKIAIGNVSQHMNGSFENILAVLQPELVDFTTREVDPWYSGRAFQSANRISDLIGITHSPIPDARNPDKGFVLRSRRVNGTGVEIATVALDGTASSLTKEEAQYLKLALVVRGKLGYDGLVSCTWPNTSENRKENGNGDGKENENENDNERRGVDPTWNTFCFDGCRDDLWLIVDSDKSESAELATNLSYVPYETREIIVGVALNPSDPPEDNGDEAQNRRRLDENRRGKRPVPEPSAEEASGSDPAPVTGAQAVAGASAPHQDEQDLDAARGQPYQRVTTFGELFLSSNRGTSLNDLFSAPRQAGDTGSGSGNPEQANRAYLHQQRRLGVPAPLGGNARYIHAPIKWDEFEEFTFGGVNQRDILRRDMASSSSSPSPPGGIVQYSPQWYKEQVLQKETRARLAAIFEQNTGCGDALRRKYAFPGNRQSPSIITPPWGVDGVERLPPTGNNYYLSSQVLTASSFAALIPLAVASRDLGVDFTAQLEIMGLGRGRPSVWAPGMHPRFLSSTCARIYIVIRSRSGRLIGPVLNPDLDLVESIIFFKQNSRVFRLLGRAPIDLQNDPDPVIAEFYRSRRIDASQSWIYFFEELDSFETTALLNTEKRQRRN